ncbi:hypothetical protein IFM89_026242 [Coptis chinensis]|uniref:histidine kinase n=1 Tax=Coptis chinensis TaxID=261450 RepID=A0A835HYM5_9MAGN|nr:hypothetical protein IFM89_026242 [Coptis chinensis]
MPKFVEKLEAKNDVEAEEMPIMDGFEATRQIWLEEKLYNVRFFIIALTAHTETDPHKQIPLAGMDFVTTKPISGDITYSHPGY